MDVTLESLIEKIKKDGVTEAKAQAEQIIQEAKKQAGQIINEAKAQAEQIISAAKVEAGKFKDNAQAAIRQAARDTILTVKEEIIKTFDKIIKDEVTRSLNPELTAQLITKIVDKWSPDENDQIEVLAADDDVDKLKDLFIEKVREKAKDKLVISTGSNINKGFRIGIKGEDVYYDFSEEAVIEVFKELINPKIKNILDG